MCRHKKFGSRTDAHSRHSLFRIFIFLGFVLERLPLPDLFIDWFTPTWVWLVVTVLVLRAPEYFGLWLAIPIGLLLDIEKFEAFGLNVLLWGCTLCCCSFVSSHCTVEQFCAADCTGRWPSAGAASAELGATEYGQ